MQNKVARIIADQVTAGDPSTVDALRALAGMPVRAIQVQQHYERRRVVEVQRDQFGKVIGSIEIIEEVEFGNSIGNWAL